MTKQSSDDLLDSYSTGGLWFYRFMSFIWQLQSCSQQQSAEVPTTETLQESVERVAKSPQGPKKFIATARN